MNEKKKPIYMTAEQIDFLERMLVNEFDSELVYGGEPENVDRVLMLLSLIEAFYGKSKNPMGEFVKQDVLRTMRQEAKKYGYDL